MTITRGQNKVRRKGRVTQSREPGHPGRGIKDQELSQPEPKHVPVCVRAGASVCVHMCVCVRVCVSVCARTHLSSFKGVWTPSGSRTKI